MPHTEARCVHATLRYLARLLLHHDTGSGRCRLITWLTATASSDRRCAPAPEHTAGTINFAGTQPSHQQGLLFGGVILANRSRGAGGGFRRTCRTDQTGDRDENGHVKTGFFAICSCPEGILRSRPTAFSAAAGFVSAVSGLASPQWQFQGWQRLSRHTWRSQKSDRQFASRQFQSRQFPHWQWRRRQFHSRQVWI